MPLAAANLSFGYNPGRPVLQSVSLEIPPGAITAIVGPNGAGKSTLLRLLLGVLRPTYGTATLDGVPVASLAESARARRIAYLPQRPSVAFAFTVREYLALGQYAARSAPPGVIDSVLERLDLADRAADPFLTLSVGQQQRASLGRALGQLGSISDRSILLADEPVSAMDPRHALQTLSILRSLASQGAAVGLVLHDLSLARRACDRAVVLDANGRIAALGPALATLAPPVLSPVFQVAFGLVGPEPGILVSELPGH